MGRPGGRGWWLGCRATRQPGNGLTACLLCSTRNTSATRSMVDSFILANSWRRQKWKKAEQSICEAGAGGGAGRTALMREVRFHTPGPGSEARVSFFLRRQDFISFRDRLSLRGSIQSSPEFICRTGKGPTQREIPQTTWTLSLPSPQTDQWSSTFVPMCPPLPRSPVQPALRAASPFLVRSVLVVAWSSGCA